MPIAFFRHLLYQENYFFSYTKCIMITVLVFRLRPNAKGRLDLAYYYSNLTNIYNIVYSLFHIMLRRACFSCIHNIFHICNIYSNLFWDTGNHLALTIALCLNSSAVSTISFLHKWTGISFWIIYVQWICTQATVVLSYKVYFSMLKCKVRSSI